VSGEDPPLRVEAVREGPHTRVTRLSIPDRTAIRKQPRGPNADRLLRHEIAVLERVRGVGGVAQLVDRPRYPDSIVLADARNSGLAELTKPLAVDELVRLAGGLARAVAGIHRRGLMHRNISPANVVVSGKGVPTLIDFALATSVQELRPEFTHHSEIVGTLTYLTLRRPAAPAGR
jgi:serine/threonine protein kinase